MFTSERNNQIVIALLKQHGIRRVVASPGATNVSFVASIQNDDFFEIYSSVDERSAAYIACGMAQESGEAVVLSCTGATASRNYLSGLTEAYYRKLPILAITSSMPLARIGHNIPQVIDRTNTINDCVRLSVNVPIVKDDEDEWNCQVKANEAMLELFHNGGGPVHINLETRQSGTFDVSELKPVRKIDRYKPNADFPELKAGRIAIMVGAHSKWSDELTAAVDSFCEHYNACVITDQTSNYKGKYGVLANLVTFQKSYAARCKRADLIIHLGNISGGYIFLQSNEVWRVNPDGRVCDTYQVLTKVFEMEEIEFFEKYNSLSAKTSNVDYHEQWRQEYDYIFNAIPELPMSNIYIAKRLSRRLPENSVLHLGILNSLRSWNFFELPLSINVYANTGGFGIDGCVSSLMGAALVEPQRLYFGVVGDLAFFYDMNVLGNRHLPSNLRLLIVNNGHGQEFCNSAHRAAQFKEKTNEFIAAGGHFGNKSESLIKNYASSLGIVYLSANDKDSFESACDAFVQAENIGAPIVLEVFTDAQNEDEALTKMCNLIVDNSANHINKGKAMARKILGDSTVEALKSFLGKG